MHSNEFIIDIYFLESVIKWAFFTIKYANYFVFCILLFCILVLVFSLLVLEIAKA